MSYSHNQPFKNREHILWEIGYCNKAATYMTILCLVFVALGIIGDLLNMKLGLASTSWLLLAVVAGVLSMSPHLHMIMARHLLGMEVLKKDQA
jgi:uncharacterized membrane protein YbaN (DUF454 family)